MPGMFVLWKGPLWLGLTINARAHTTWMRKLQQRYEARGRGFEQLAIAA